MDELIKLVAKKTGIPEAQAKIAAETVIGFLKQRLPAPIAAQLDALIAGGQLGKSAEGLASGLGSIIGKK